MYARYVAQLTRKRTVNEPGCATDAMNPAVEPADCGAEVHRQALQRVRR